MNTYIFEPLVKIGNIPFLEKREKIRGILGEYSEFRKTKFSKNTTDDFGMCQVFYDEKNRCEAVEFGKNGVKITMNNVELTGLSINELTKYLYSLDDTIEISKDSITSKKAGISVYAPNGQIETLLFFCDGYFKH